MFTCRFQTVVDVIIFIYLQSLSTADQHSFLSHFFYCKHLHPFFPLWDTATDVVKFRLLESVANVEDGLSVSCFRNICTPNVKLNSRHVKTLASIITSLGTDNSVLVADKWQSQ